MTPERFALLRNKLQARQPDLTVLTEDVHKPHNVSAILRTCDAVGIPRVHAVSGDTLIPRYHLTSGGSRKWVELAVHGTLDEAIHELKDQEFQIIAAHLSSCAQDFRELDYTGPTAIVLGSELTGVSREAAALADQHAMIPMHGMVASLNVSVANAVILYEAERQRQAAGLYDRCRIPEPQFSAILFEWAYPEIARRCRARSLDYPPLDAEGSMLNNPLSDST